MKTLTLLLTLAALPLMAQSTGHPYSLEFEETMIAPNGQRLVQKHFYGQLKDGTTVEAGKSPVLLDEPSDYDWRSIRWADGTWDAPNDHYRTVQRQMGPAEKRLMNERKAQAYPVCWEGIKDHSKAKGVWPGSLPTVVGETWVQGHRMYKVTYDDAAMHRDATIWPEADCTEVEYHIVWHNQTKGGASDQQSIRRLLSLRDQEPEGRWLQVPATYVRQSGVITERQHYMKKLGSLAKAPACVREQDKGKQMMLDYYGRYGHKGTEVKNLGHARVNQ